MRLGFRPFYLGAAAFTALSVPVWVTVFLGKGSLPSTVNPMLWHAHEMLFGFAGAVIVGFLLTAGKAWTGLRRQLRDLRSARRRAADRRPRVAARAAAGNLRNLPLVAILLLPVIFRIGRGCVKTHRQGM